MIMIRQTDLSNLPDLFFFSAGSSGGQSAVPLFPSADFFPLPHSLPLHDCLFFQECPMLFPKCKPPWWVCWQCDITKPLKKERLAASRAGSCRPFEEKKERRRTTGNSILKLLCYPSDCSSGFVYERQTLLSSKFILWLDLLFWLSSSSLALWSLVVYMCNYWSSISSCLISCSPNVLDCCPPS